MKKLLIGLTSLLVILFNGCGGGGGDSDSSVSADGIAIIYHYPAEICKSDALLAELEAAMPPEAENISTLVATNDVTCATYGKIDGVDCGTGDAAILVDPSYEVYDTSCVISFDVNIAAKTIMDTQTSEDITLAAKFALDAQ